MNLETDDSRGGVFAGRRAGSSFLAGADTSFLVRLSTFFGTCVSPVSTRVCLRVGEGSLLGGVFLLRGRWCEGDLRGSRGIDCWRRCGDCCRRGGCLLRAGGTVRARCWYSCVAVMRLRARLLSNIRWIRSSLLPVVGIFDSRQSVWSSGLESLES